MTDAWIFPHWDWLVFEMFWGSLTVSPGRPGLWPARLACWPVWPAHPAAAALVSSGPPSSANLQRQQRNKLRQSRRHGGQTVLTPVLKPLRHFVPRGRLLLSCSGTRDVMRQMKISTKSLISWRRNFSNDTVFAVWFKDYRASTWQFGSSAANLLDSAEMDTGPVARIEECVDMTCTHTQVRLCVCVCTVKLCWPEQTHLTDCHVNLQRHDAHRDMWGNTFPQGHAARFKTSVVILKTQTTV